MHGNADLALLDLEPPQIIRNRRVERPPEECGETADIADVVALGRHREMAHGNVV
ncbi:hypothetical protein [Mesorhizobium koreense]|uniref:hypothetical protein n=1 Tax=Mesorhizobium koreense TaxID=3074855 RepID=UPI003FA556CD